MIINAIWDTEAAPRVPCGAQKGGDTSRAVGNGERKGGIISQPLTVTHYHIMIPDHNTKRRTKEWLRLRGFSLLLVPACHPFHTRGLDLSRGRPSSVARIAIQVGFEWAHRPQRGAELQCHAGAAAPGQGSLLRYSKCMCGERKMGRGRVQHTRLCQFCGFRLNVRGSASTPLSGTCMPSCHRKRNDGRQQGQCHASIRCQGLEWGSYSHAQCTDAGMPAQ